MFKNSKTFSSFSVDNLEKAKQFYREILGLEVAEKKEMGLLELQLIGGTKVLIYPKPDHVPATFTVLNFLVPDIEAAVTGLKEQGVVFESYNQEHLKTGEDQISRGEGPKIAWFKDPAGNILAVLEMKD
jgi:catechol 2,3-dioxygenase-like lactoylglutathione lyase family enzyme